MEDNNAQGEVGDELTRLVADKPNTEPFPAPAPIPRRGIVGIELFRLALILLVLGAVWGTYMHSSRIEKQIRETKALNQEIKRQQLISRELGYVNRAMSCAAIWAAQGQSGKLPAPCRDPHVLRHFDPGASRAAG